MTKKNNKSFDCVAFKHKAQSHIYKKIAGLDAADQAVYLEKLATQGSLGKWWQEVRRYSKKKRGVHHKGTKTRRVFTKR